MTTNTTKKFAGYSAKVIRALAAQETKPEKLAELLAHAQERRSAFAAQGKPESKIKRWDRAIAEVGARMGLGGSAPAPAFTFTSAPVPKKASKTKAKAKQPKAVASDMDARIAKLEASNAEIMAALAAIAAKL